MGTMESRINQLLEIMQTLRDPKKGCPWDLQQDFASIVPHTLEEAYEVADTIEQGELDALPDELGDLLFQIVFYAQIASEQGRFDFTDVVASICDKLIRRHPHVFADTAVEDVASQTRLWEQLKKQERGDVRSESSLLDGVLNALPALTRAEKIQRKAAHAGFDWDATEEVVEKVEEELTELQDVLKTEANSPERIEEEFGDLLFSMVNLSRHLNVDSEGALRRATRKFESRFRSIEVQLHKQGESVENSSREQLERQWQLVKLDEKRGRE